MDSTDRLDKYSTVSLLKAIIESAPTAIVMVDGPGTILLVNAETEYLFGYDREELLGQAVEVLVPERYRAAHPGQRAHYFNAPVARRMGAGRDLYGLRKDGSEFPVEIGLNPIETKEGHMVLSAIIDITKRKGLEAELYQLNKELEDRVQERTGELEQANKALERSNLELKKFAYIASHDLQSPLRSISGFVQLLQSEYEGQLDAQADDWIRRTVRSIQQMQRLIQDLLVYSRASSEIQRYQEISVREIFDDAVFQLDAAFKETGGEVSCGELPVVTGDRSQLAQLLQNLIGNGLKYHGAAPPRIHVSVERGNGEWVFAVSDNGIGIDARFHDRIFELFQRLHDQNDYPGTGIGLAVCRRVVLDHGGKIWLESEPGNGSTFYFTIPEQEQPS